MNTGTEKLRRCVYARNIQIFTKEWSRNIVIVVLLSMLTGCSINPPATFMGTPVPFSCAKFTERRWQEFRFGVASLDDTIATVISLWDIDNDQLTHYGGLGYGLDRASWGDVKQGVFYSTLFREKQLQKFDVKFEPPPTLTQVLDCLGPPEYYAAYEEATVETYSFILMLWYLEKGFVVQHSSYYTLVRPTVDLSAQLMQNFFVVAPGTLEQMVLNVYTLGHDPDVQAWGLCVLRPWPGSIESIEIESFNVENPRCPSPQQ